MTASNERGRAPGHPPAHPRDPHQNQPAAPAQPLDPQYAQQWAAHQQSVQEYAAAPQGQAQPAQPHYPAPQQAPGEPQHYAAPQDPQGRQPQPAFQGHQAPAHQPAAQSDIYGQPGGYQYPQDGQHAAAGEPAHAGLSSYTDAAAQTPPSPSAHAPQFDAYQPPANATQPAYDPAAYEQQAASDQSAAHAASYPASVLPSAVPTDPHSGVAYDQAPATEFDVGANYGAAPGPAWSEHGPQEGADPYQPASQYGQAPAYQEHAEYQQFEPAAYEPPAYEAPTQQAPAFDNATYQQAQTYSDPALDPNGYQPPPMAHDHGGLEAVGSGGEMDAQYADGYDEDYYDEQPRGRRSMVVIGALIGAIAVGGGLAYGYKSILGTGASTGPSKVVRSQSAPAKVKPSDPGGKQFAHRDSKVLGRLGDKGSSAKGARKVSTLSIGRDGIVRGGATGATVAASETSASAEVPSVDVPGISVVDAFAKPAAGAQQQGRRVETLNVNRNSSGGTAVQPPAKRAPAKPIIIAETKPTAAAPRPKPKPKPQPAQLGATPQKVAARTKPKSSGSATRNGYVVVLASVPVSGTSRVKALTQFANIQQKYGTILGGKKPDVVEADLGAKGTYHRLLVGPPGSRNSASRLCAKLKSAGYGGCWVTAY